MREEVVRVVLKVNTTLWSYDRIWYSELAMERDFPGLWAYLVKKNFPLGKIKVNDPRTKIEVMQVESMNFPDKEDADQRTLVDVRSSDQPTS